MSSVRIQLLTAATTVAAAAMPASYAADALVPPALAGNISGGNVLLVPLQNGSISALRVGMGVPEVLSLSGLAAVSRRVSAAEDQWLRHAIARSSRLVAKGKLVSRNA